MTTTENKKFEVGVKVINRFIVEAESSEEAIKIIYAKKDREVVTDSLLKVDYIYEL